MGGWTTGPKLGYSNYTCFAPFRVNSPGGIFTTSRLLSYAVPLFLLQLSLTHIVTTLARFSLKPFNQPVIVSEIIGGIIVGPTVLGRNKTYYSSVFPQGNLLVINTLEAIGIIYYLFILAVRLDIRMMLKPKRKALVISVIGLFFSFVFTTTTTAFLGEYLPEHLVKSHLPTSLSALLAVSTFPSIHPIIKEFNLLNNKLARLGMSAAIVNDLFGWIFRISIQTIRLSSRSLWWAMGELALLGGFVILTTLLLRPLIHRINRGTQKGKPVTKGDITIMLLGVMMAACISDAMGATADNGPLIMGYIVPPGSPLGVAVVEKSETVMHTLLVPYFYIENGMRMGDISSIKDKRMWIVLHTIMFSGYAGKLAGTMLACLYYKMSMMDSFTVGLILNLRGFPEMIIFRKWFNLGVIDNETYSAIMLSALGVTMIATPLLRRLCQRSTRLFSVHRASIEHSTINTELRVLACAHGEENVPPIINLLEASYATIDSPICVYVMHLVELVGRATPVLIEHKPCLKLEDHDQRNHIINAFRNYERRNGANVLVVPFTTMSPYKTMHEDICNLAAKNRVSIIIVPFHRQQAYGRGANATERIFHLVASNILVEASCSVGILVSQKDQSGCIWWATSLHFSYKVGIVFLGGADDREALSYASRMVAYPSVSLMVVRCLTSENKGNDNKKEKVMDDELVAKLRIGNAGNKQFDYKEEAVGSSEEMINAIRCMGTGFNLMIVGRRHEAHTAIIGELSEWSDYPELGALGDLLSSQDFSTRMASVLVVQQCSFGGGPGIDASCAMW